jgi:ATP/maltotriose-dependent transcriptional regulator MalT
MALACFAGYGGYYHHALPLALEWVDRGLAAASEAGRPGACLQVDLTAIRSRIEADTGELDRAERTARQALDQATALAYDFGRHAALVALGWVSERQGDAAAAVVHYTDGLAEIDRLGLVALRAWPLLSRAHALLEVDRLAEAEADVARASADARRCGDRRGLLLASVTRGLLHLARRRTAEAEEALRRAVDLATQLGDRRLEGRSLVALAAAHAQRGDLDQARELLARGLAHERPTAVAQPLERVLRAELDRLGGADESETPRFRGVPREEVS